MGDADIESHHAYAMGKNARYELVPIEEEGEPSTSTSAVVVTDENWLSLCNMGGLHEVSFRRYWRGEIARSGRAASVSKLLSRFTDAVHSRLHHGAIRLAYAVEMRTQQEKKKDEEIAVALAAFCANHSRLRWTQQEEEEETTKGRSATSMSEAFQQMRRAVRNQEVPLDQKMGFSKKYGAFMSDPLYLRSVPALEPSGLLSSAEGLGEFVRHVMELYLCKPNILSLHMVTGLHALIVLKPYYTEEDFEKALRTHWTSTGVLYLHRANGVLGCPGCSRDWFPGRPRHQIRGHLPLPPRGLPGARGPHSEGSEHARQGQGEIRRRQAYHSVTDQ